MQELENQRLELVKLFQKLRFWGVIGGIFSFILLVIGITFKLGVFSMLPLIGTGYLVYYLWNQKYSIFRKNYKKIIVADTISKLNPSPQFAPKGFVAQEYFAKSKIFLVDYTSYLGEDWIGYGDFGQLQLSELFVTKYINSKNTKLYFNGIFGTANFPFWFQGMTTISTKSLLNIFLEGKKLDNNLQRVTLESPRFGEIFDVFSDSQIGARLILTPDIMNTLLDLSSEFGNVTFSFLDNQMFFAIEKSSFGEFLEANWRQPVTEVNSKLVKDLNLVKHLVDTFRLYRNN